MKKLFEQRLGSRRGTIRLAALLLVITLSIVASKVGEDYFIKALRQDCDSLFADRLVPATTLFLLSDAVHQRRDVLVELLHGPSGGDVAAAQHRLGEHEAAIENHIGAIEATYLVDDESRLLRELRASLRAYEELESSLVSRYGKGERLDASVELRAAFDELRQELHNLTKVQQMVGQELRSESLASATSVTALLYLQLGVAFALGILASGLAMSLRTRGPDSIPPQKGAMH